MEIVKKSAIFCPKINLTWPRQFHQYSSVFALYWSDISFQNKRIHGLFHFLFLFYFFAFFWFFLTKIEFQTNELREKFNKNQPLINFRSRTKLKRRKRDYFEQFLLLLMMTMSMAVSNRNTYVLAAKLHFIFSIFNLGVCWNVRWHRRRKQWLLCYLSKWIVWVNNNKWIVL